MCCHEFRKHEIACWPIASKQASPPSPWGNAERWTRLLKDNDHRKIWKSIGWNGDVDETQKEAPSDEEFKIHFEQLLNPQEMVADDLHDTSDSPYIPILDDPIEQIEIMEAAESRIEEFYRDNACDI